MSEHVGWDDMCQQIADDAYLADVTTLPLEALRVRRRECQLAEDRISFVRRMVQGRLDVIRTELRGRAAGGDPSDASALVAKMPDTLTEHRRRDMHGSAGGRGRPALTRIADLDDAGADLAHVDEMCAPTELARIGEHDVDALARLERSLAAHEEHVSELRRRVFTRLDALAAELADRYRRGEINVDSLLVEMRER